MIAEIRRGIFIIIGCAVLVFLVLWPVVLISLAK